VSSSRPAAVVVLAAGEGKRMRSATPKVLHAIGGRTLIGHAVAAARTLEPEHLVVVVRHGRDQVVAHLTEIAPDVVIAEQDDVPGTARAARCGLAALPPLHGTVVVTYGDVPLLTGSTLEAFVAAHHGSGAAVTVLTSEPADARDYGRIVRDSMGELAAIVERKDATAMQAAIGEINTGIYAFDAEFLTKALERIGVDNVQGEAYLTDTVAMARSDGLAVGAVLLAHALEAEGVNDRVELATLGRALRDRLVAEWMRAGVTVIDPQTTWIDVGVELAADVTILPGSQLLGRTRVASGATIGPDSTVLDCDLAEGSSVTRSQITGAVIGAGASVGPFSFVRPGTRLGAGGRIGGFVETKNAVIGAGSKVPHLSYVGDAEIGEGSNIGAATIFANYDGVDKHRTVVGDHVRIGSDSILVPPLTIGDGAYTAAGSVITTDVPPGALAVGRGRQRNIEGWVQRKRAGSPAALAAAAAGTAAGSADQDAAPDQDQVATTPGVADDSSEGQGQ
jgi:bifunctional UDP-N-acetylglucosamine pyrophosphorylase/glucosamine-1-phosphate N-acetyltransferase